MRSLRSFAFILFLVTASIGRAQGQSTVGRPILFVHGFCGDVDGWDAF